VVGGALALAASDCLRLFSSFGLALDVKTSRIGSRGVRRAEGRMRPLASAVRRRNREWATRLKSYVIIKRDLRRYPQPTETTTPTSMIYERTLSLGWTLSQWARIEALRVTSVQSYGDQRAFVSDF
jgi:hypothetical protein